MNARTDFRRAFGAWRTIFRMTRDAQKTASEGLEVESPSEALLADLDANPMMHRALCACIKGHDPLNSKQTWPAETRRETVRRTLSNKRMSRAVRRWTMVQS